MSIETNVPGSAGTAADHGTLQALDWTPSLDVRVGGWTWRVDPEDRLLPGDDRREDRERQRELVRAFVMAPLLLG